MRTLSPQELATVSGAGLLGFLLKQKTTVKVGVAAGWAGGVCVYVSNFLATVNVNVRWNGGSADCGCGGGTPAPEPEPELVIS